MTKAHHHKIKLMGCDFVISAVHHNPDTAWTAIRACVDEIDRIECLISSWKDDSETTAINRNAGIRPVKVCRELFDLIYRSLKVSEITAGSFDISGNVSRTFWDFKSCKQSLLDQDKVNRLRDLINYHHIQLDQENNTVFLQKEGMQIGFGGIGKGYAAQKGSAIMKGMGVNSGLINAAGDIMCWGQPPQQEFWSVKVPNPYNLDEAAIDINVPFGSIVTSGDYENYVLIDGERYSHIVDPRTGLPVRHMSSVTVICPNPELGDALATALSVLGPTRGTQLINRLNAVESIVIDDQGEYYYSKNLKAFAA